MPFERFIDDYDKSLSIYRHTNSRTNFTHRTPDKLVEDNPMHGYFLGALGSLGDFLDKEPAINENKLLSVIGKSEKIEPLRAAAVNGIARVAATMEKYEGTINASEAKLLAVPELASGDAGGAMVDREIREYFRSQPVEAQTRLIASMNEGPAHARIEMALLRSPIALLDHQTKMIGESWDLRSRNANPSEAFEIENARTAIAWARAGIAHLVGVTLLVTHWKPEQVLKSLMDGKDDYAMKGVKVFGFTDQAIARARAVADMERRKEIAASFTR